VYKTETARPKPRRLWWGGLSLLLIILTGALAQFESGGINAGAEDELCEGAASVLALGRFK
jgi:hypothetical protein